MHNAALASGQHPPPTPAAQSESGDRAPEPSPALDPERWPEAHGDLLFAFALARVRERTTAQDLVQETFLAALKARSSFAGRSTERAWLFGILRNKLTDYYRRQSREVPLADPETLEHDEGQFFQGGGLGKDGWIRSQAPRRWASPDESLAQKEFQGVFHRCLSRLPDRVAQVFLLREVDDVSSEQICKDLNLSPNNLWVILHRARLALRRCLELHWFGRRQS